MKNVQSYCSIFSSLRSALFGIRGIGHSEWIEAPPPMTSLSSSAFVCGVQRAGFGLLPMQRLYLQPAPCLTTGHSPKGYGWTPSCRWTSQSIKIEAPF